MSEKRYDIRGEKIYDRYVYRELTIEEVRIELEKYQSLKSSLEAFRILEKKNGIW